MCPKPLDELLAAPDVPKVALRFGSDDGAIIWLNGKKIFEDKYCHPLSIDQSAFQYPLLSVVNSYNLFRSETSE